MKEHPVHTIKVLIIIPTLQCGGSEKYVVQLCNTSRHPQIKITLAVLDNSAAFYTISNPLVTVIDLGVKKVRASFFKIRKLVQQLQPGIIYTTANHLNLYMALFKNVMAPGVVIVARESSIVSINNRRAKWPALYNLLVTCFYKRLNGIVCQSAYMQNDLLMHYRIKKERTVVIHNAVEATGPVNMAVQPNKFITVARLSEEKGLCRLIRAVAGLAIPFSYYIIGAGPQKEELEHLIAALGLQEKVFLMGEKTDPYKGMDDAAFFLLGSYYEGFPNAVLEAGALGIPVIAFDAPGGIGEIITHGSNGLLVKNDDAGAFTQTIERAATIDFDRQQIAASTLRLFAIAQTVQQTETFFLKIISRSCK